ncbi:lipase family protein [Nocardia transvalensis]|uniref:lipase family protein n=1 Tax=Nocardia transvalensis TaxID=37333 RepID=UPI00189612E6|nr:lipase family protein [Nocardia transvalensis]MBF6329869.1 lipase [Nocardia transvalensis]
MGLSALLVVVGMVVGAGGAAAGSDDFYQVPADLAGVENGFVLQSRPITAVAVVVPIPVAAWQVKYKTVDAHGVPTAAVATVLVPYTPWAGPGPRPLLSYQEAEDSVGAQCAISHSLREGLAAGPGPGLGGSIRMATAALTQGWAVVAPDHEGPRSEFMAGPMAAHAVLDGIRAALRFPPAGLSGATPVGLMGYSGGAFASGWAAEQQPHYAPEINLVGAALGGMPGDMREVGRAVDGGPYTGFLIGALIGLDRAYPEADAAAMLNDKGRAVLDRDRNRCVLDLLDEHRSRRLSELTTTPDPLGDTVLAKLLADNSLGKATPRTPIFEYHATGDDVTPLPATDTVLDAYCTAGTPVQRLRIPGDHMSGGPAATPYQLSYLADRFAGTPAPSTC